MGSLYRFIRIGFLDTGSTVHCPHKLNVYFRVSLRFTVARTRGASYEQSWVPLLPYSILLPLVPRIIKAIEGV